MALAGVTTVGGLAALVDRSISAADAIGKTADKIGVGVEALQELRFAAKASGVEQQTLDMALQRFTRRAAEAAQGTGEAKDALAQMGIALRDQSGNLRRSEDLLGDVADAFARIEDPAERVRLSVPLPSPFVAPPPGSDEDKSGLGRVQLPGSLGPFAVLVIGLAL